jgi:hypothetical protein
MRSIMKISFLINIYQSKGKSSSDHDNYEIVYLNGLADLFHKNDVPVDLTLNVDKAQSLSPIPVHSEAVAGSVERISPNSGTEN